MMCFALADHAAEGVEHGHLFGAGRLQVFQHQGLAIGIQVLAFGGHDFGDVGLGFGHGVYAVHLQAGQLARQRLADVGGRVGGGEVDAVAALHQAHGQRGGDGGFAHAALAHDHDEPVPGAGQLVGQLAQGVGGEGGGRGVHAGRGGFGLVI
jgi:hypothetical protein